MSSPARTSRTQRQTRWIRRSWSVGGLLIVALAAGGWYGLSVRPAANRLDDAWDDVEHAYAYLAREDHVKEVLADIRRKNQRLAEQLAQRQARVGAHLDNIAFLAWFSEMATQRRLAVNDYRPAETVPYGDFQGHSLMLTGAGSFEAVCRMLDDLRECRQLNRITNLSLAPVDAERTTLTFSMRLELITKADNVASLSRAQGER